MDVTEGEMTKDVEVMLGSPKKAVIRMAIPMIVAMFASSVNGLIDAAWISGINAGALAAIGFLFPLFFILVGVSSGVSIGASAAIARHIGAGDRNGTDRTASVALSLTLVSGIVFSILLFLITRPLMIAVGGAAVIDYCMDYANILFMFATVFFINALMSSILRSEGAARRSMVVMVTSALFNLVLDPIFMFDDVIFGFGLGMGMTGAALATAVALILATIPAVYWFWIKKDTYVNLRFGRPHFDKVIAKDIYRVGIPASVEFMAISLAVILMNMILVSTAEGTDAVAIYSAGWRLLNLVMIPCLGIGAAVVPICAAAYGGKEHQKVKMAFGYALKISLITMLILATILFIAADIVSVLFSYSTDAEHLHGPLSLFIQISCAFLPFIGFGVLSSSLFQALGMGTRALTSTVFRNFIIIPVAYIVSLSGTLMDIWIWTAVMEVIGPAIVLMWCLMTLSAFIKKNTPAVQ